MISLGTVFWLMVAFFALIGTLRGWTKEIIATSGLILSLFALNQFGYFLISLLGAAADATTTPVDTMAIRRQQFYILTTVHLLIAFFSYQGPALAGRRLGDRLRVRDSLQDKVLGAIVGYFPLPPGEFYPFDTIALIRPGIESPLASLIAKLPLPLLAPYLPFLVVVVFLFVIVVMI